MTAKKLVETVKKAVTKKEVEVRCPVCKGIGRIPPHEFYHVVACEVCQGTGLAK